MVEEKLISIGTRALTVFLVVAILLSGVAVWGVISGIETGGNNDVEFSGKMTVENDTFVMDGAVTVGGSFGDESEPPKYRHVRILLYSADGALQATHTVGTVQLRRNVSLNLTFVPHYIVLTSPDFWSPNVEDVAYYKKVDGGYSGYEVVNREELPVTPPTPTKDANST